MQSEDQSLSVIVPVRNSGNTVARAFESILSQTRKPRNIRVFRYEYLQILAGYITGLAIGYSK